MVAFIYQAYLKSGCELEYQKLWHEVASYFINYRGALGSCLHKTADGLWLAYSRWPDKETRDASWPSENNPCSQELPEHIQNAIVAIKNCLNQDQKIPDLTLEVIDDLLV
jgi:hypothetical protein